MCVKIFSYGDKKVPVRVEGPEAHLVPWMQLDNCEIILNILEIDLKPEWANSTTKREKSGHIEEGRKCRDVV